MWRRIRTAAGGRKGRTGRFLEGSPGKAAWVLVGDPRVTAGGMTEVVHKAEGQGLAFGPGVSHLSLGVLGTAVTALALQGRLT